MFLGFVGFGVFLLFLLVWGWVFFGFWVVFFKGSLIPTDFHAGTETVFKTLGWVCISERTTDSRG